MREIKFRAWDNENRKIYSVHTYSFSTLILIDYGYWGEQVYNKGISREDATPQRTIDDWHNDFIVMQYTGLHDKNGKEIYEGDIVKVVKGTGMPCLKSTKEKTFFCEVYFSNDGYRYRCPKDYGNFRFGQHLSNTEVIGNIWENPELLN